MDEPLSNLDEERKQKITMEILDLHKQFSFTLVYVTHDRLEAKMLASRICEMQEGRLRSLAVSNKYDGGVQGSIPEE
jgi:ABC-type sugar transport system ATPase subunit